MTLEQHNPLNLMADMRPSAASVATVVSAGSQAAVLAEIVRGWAALATVLLGVPTAALMLIYWFFKVKNEWQRTTKSKSLD